MAEGTRASRKLSHRAIKGHASKIAEGASLNAEGRSRAVTQTLSHGQIKTGGAGMQAGLNLNLSGFEHAQVTRAAFDQQQIGVAVAGPDGRIQRANGALASLLNYSQKELAGMALKNLVRAPGRKQSLSRGRKGVRHALQMPPAVNYLARKSGDVIACHVDSRALHNAGGKVTHFLLFVTDARPKRSTEEINQPEKEVYQAQAYQTLGMLAGGIAHDFNNALEVILGFASLAQFRLSPSDPLHEPLKIIEESAKGAADIARKLLDATRDNPDDEGVVDTGELMGGALRIVSRTFDRKIRVEHRIDAQLPCIRGNRNRLQQAVLNLCINARDAMPRGGTLAIEASSQTLDRGDARLPESSAPGPYVRIVIRDSGEGMPAEVMEKIFVPLFTTKGATKGHGLGLAMVDQIIKEAGGFVSVASKPGEGSEFCLYLPAVFNKRPRVVKSQPNPIASGRARVLVVDDEPRILEFLEKGLTRLGYDVMTAESGAKACEIYSKKSEEIDCVLIDLIMPGMRGLEAYTRLKNINPAVKVILSSGYSSGQIKRESAKAGGPEFLEKPYTLEELSRALKKLQ